MPRSCAWRSQASAQRRSRGARCTSQETTSRAWRMPSHAKRGSVNIAGFWSPIPMTARACAPAGSSTNEIRTNPSAAAVRRMRDPCTRIPALRHGYTRAMRLDRQLAVVALTLVAAALGAAAPAGASLVGAPEQVAGGLLTPWEVVLVPDGRTWVTERDCHVREIGAGGAVRMI